MVEFDFFTRPAVLDAFRVCWCGSLDMANTDVAP